MKRKNISKVYWILGIVFFLGVLGLTTGEEEVKEDEKTKKTMREQW